MDGKWIVFDMDGTICDSDWREKHIKAPAGVLLEDFKPNWDAFHRECVHDTPHEDMVRILNCLNACGHPVAICTGRNDKYRGITLWWMELHEVPHDLLLMRPDGNFDSDKRIKLRLLQEAGITPANTMAVFEDRDVMVEAWREAGFRCLQVKKGTY